MSLDTTPHNAAQELVRNLVANDPIQGWDQAWKVKATPWDAGDVQPPLRDLLHCGVLHLPPAGRALIPGCGKGYDAILIATATGLETTAVDISETALKQANDLLNASQVPSNVVVQFENKDFFSLGQSEKEKFDLVFDHTFFVAISPERRKEWGQVMSRLVKPGGYLITLIFPIDPPQDYGPPWFVRPEHYLETLGEGWEKIVDKVPEISLPTHKDREHLVVWKKL